MAGQPAHMTAQSVQEVMPRTYICKETPVWQDGNNSFKFSPDDSPVLRQRLLVKLPVRESHSPSIALHLEQLWPVGQKSDAAPDKWSQSSSQAFAKDHSPAEGQISLAQPLSHPVCNYASQRSHISYFKRTMLITLYAILQSNALAYLKIQIQYPDPLTISVTAC